MSICLFLRNIKSIIFFIGITFSSFSQDNTFDLLKAEYNRLTQEQKLDSALFVAREMSSWALRNEGDTSLRYALSFKFLGGTIYNLYRDSAMYYWQKSLDLLYQQQRAETIHAAQCYQNMGLFYLNKTEYELSKSLYIRANVIYELITDKSLIDYAQCMFNLGFVYARTMDVESAEKCFYKTLELYKSIYSNESKEYVSILGKVGRVFFEIGDYNSSEKCYSEMYRIVKKNGEENIYYQVAIINLSQLYALRGNFSDARALNLKSIEYATKYYGENSKNKAESLMAYASLFSDFGFPDSAVHYNILAIKAFENLQSEKLNLSIALENIGNSYTYLAMLKEAEICFERSAKLKKEIGDTLEGYASVLLGQGWLNVELNKLELGYKNFLDALRIYEKVYGLYHPITCYALQNIGTLYTQMGAYTKALETLEIVKEIRGKVLGIKHPEYSRTILSIGCLSLEMGNYESAIQCFTESINIYENNVNQYNAFLGDAFHNLGNVYFKIKEYKLAEKYYSKSMNALKELNVINLESHYFQLGLTKSFLNEHGSAECLISDGLDLLRVEIEKKIRWLSSKEKQLFVSSCLKYYEKISTISCMSYNALPSISNLSYNNLLLFKSLLLETSREFDKVISNYDNEELRSQFNEMKQLWRVVSKMQSEGSDKKELIDRYSAQADSIDKILVNQLGEYFVAKRKFEITWKDVQSVLSKNEVAIEFCKYYDFDLDVYYYFALVVRPEYKHPKLVKIGTEPKIKEAIQMKDFSTLYNLVWQGLDSLLEGVDRVYFSPDGELNNLSFSGLYHRNNGSDSISYLIDRYELHQLTTTRYLADGTLKKQHPFESSAVLLGGIDYNQIPTVDATSKGEESNEDYLLQLNLDKEIQQSRSSSFSSKMPSLKGTEIEVKTITGMLNHSGWNTTSYTGQSAGENQIKYDLLQKSPGLLHIATHGFAFPDIVKKETDLMQMNEKSTYKASEDPMVRCGLMLSGSNISWAGEPKKMIEQTGDDGILTAAEVANMDLSNTKLVVLSACETGLGKIEGSEGTFGLKRAFKLAGVEQLIVSLWSVPDKETMELMTLFYTDLSLTKDPVVSFQKAQREMRYRYPTEPEKWAGFVLVR